VELKTAYLKEFEGGIFGFGGGGGLTLGRIRIGGFGMGGDRESQSKRPFRGLTSPTDDHFNTITKLSYSYGLGYIGYEFLRLGDFRFAVDIGLGGGTIELKNIDRASSQSIITWEHSLGSHLYLIAYSRVLSMNFFYYQPSLVIEYIYGGFTKFFIAGDYSGIVNGKWKQDGEFELMNVPKMKFNGFSIRAGVYLGIFL
ncbi:MAG: hypothetical protein KJ666_14085, partial [Bacteroidetes bacterium]|nr:hypothetical protein [Bacteroidota bacterium]